ncbi:MAG: ADP-ribosylglycohydrolase family protein [Gammaproteobacteria bacterium]|nr:ADP-ribosylglycohydrolase family protein [Gammaproteobacteria bacterium]MBV9622227.1 ADP-ribosylglycohydrolase family protein [Gammaproteobacteria bacterium]
MEATPPAASRGTPGLGNAYWVVPGRFLAGEHPAAAGTATLRARLKALRAAGINCFIDLTEAGEAVSYARELPAGVAYFRQPIHDHGLPDSPARMSEILDCLAAALRDERRVYLHCRAGIGRTGTVAGCWLVEQGRTGTEALAELNRLWQQSPRSLQWSSIPETDSQIDYVRRWRRDGTEADPLLEAATLAAARGLRSRFLGTLLGLAAGDAVAAATQYRRPGRFTPVGDMLGGGPFDLPRGAWSDDTAMALCLAESLLETGGFDARDQMGRYRRWQKEGHLSATGTCVGITAGTARALARAQWRRQPFSGTHDPEALDPETLSRVPAVVLYFFADPQAAVEQAAQAARTTCQSPGVLTACRALARALHAALSGGDKAAIVAAAEELVGSTARPQALGQEGTAPAALAAALRVFSRSESFREAVLAAANLGGASDVVAGTCGALAGAHYGLRGIPALWRNSLMQRELLEGFTDRLLAHALLTFGG